MIQVEFMGFVNRIREYDWGTVYEMSHNQSEKQPDGTWKVTGKDYLSVVGPAGFAVDDMVTVKGTLKTKLFDKKDGSGKGVALNVSAKEMSKDATAKSTDPNYQPPAADNWENAPF